VCSYATLATSRGRKGGESPPERKFEVKRGKECTPRKLPKRGKRDFLALGGESLLEERKSKKSRHRLFASSYQGGKEFKGGTKKATKKGADKPLKKRGR